MEVIELSHKDVLSILPERDVCAHKGSFGRIMLLCGSRGYTGAAALAAMGALRAGEGEQNAGTALASEGTVPSSASAGRF